MLKMNLMSIQCQKPASTPPTDCYNLQQGVEAAGRMSEAHEQPPAEVSPLTQFPVSSVQRRVQTTPCIRPHPALPIGKYVIFGGMAAKPIVEDADIYVSLHKGASSGLATDVWSGGICDPAVDLWPDGKTIEISFPIVDWSIPDDDKKFKQLVTFLGHQLTKGLKIHVGCVGGHGRTGMVLTAIYAQMTGDKDAIQYVREHYCGHAVETKSQVKFLMEHYGVSDPANLMPKNDPGGETQTAPVLLGLPKSLVELGVRVFPVEYRGKTPLIKEWPTEASCDPAKIAAWDQQYPGRNWALACGPESGVFVLDVDGEDGKASMAELCKAHGDSWTGTLRVKTAHGWHLYFKCPENVLIRSTVKKLADGLDIRGKGGAAMIPPSIHPDDIAYQWVNADAPIVDAPSWLLEMIDRLSFSQTDAIAEPLPIIKGARNSTLASLAGTMRRRGISPATIEDALIKENALRCTPPLPEAEVREIAKSISRYSPAEPVPPPLGATSLTDGIPEMSENSMYGKAGDLAKELGTPLSLAYPTMLAVCSVIPGVEPTPDIRTNLYVALLGPKGGGKSETCKRAIALAKLNEDAIKHIVPGSDRGLQKLIGNEGPPGMKVLLYQDELRNTLSKMNIQNSSLPSTLCTLWCQDTAGSADKTGNHSINARMTILGCLKANDPGEYAEVFGARTNDGLADRFLFGLAIPPWEFSPWERNENATNPITQQLYPPPKVQAVQSKVPKYFWDKMSQWRGSKKDRNRRLGEQVMRIALITSCVNGDEWMTDEALDASIRFCEWQELIAAQYKAGQAETLSGKCTEAILTALKAIPPGMAAIWSDLAKRKHWYAKFGSTMPCSCRDALVKEGVICYERKTGRIWLPPEQEN